MEKLHEMGWKYVTKAYRKCCEEENYTDEWKEKLRRGEVEGAYLDEEID